MFYKLIIRGVLSFLTLFLLLFLLVNLYLLDIPDWIVAKSIPSYPNAKVVTIKTYSGLPDTFREALIVFRTNDAPNSIFDYYKNKLREKDWHEENYQISNYRAETPNQYLLEHTKNIFGMTFKTRVVKILNTPDSSAKESEIIISVRHQGLFSFKPFLN